MGLRERKKARLRASILETAVELAGRSGFDALRVRELTDRLEISEATFFNYFSSKAELLDAWLADELANAFAQLAGESRNRRSALRQRVQQLARAAGAAEGLAAAAWRQGRLQPAAGEAVARSDLVALLTASREAGELRRDITPVELAELLVASVGFAIAAALGSGELQPEARALRAADLVFDGARRRHERVRLGSWVAPPAGPA